MKEKTHVTLYKIVVGIIIKRVLTIVALQFKCNYLAEEIIVKCVLSSKM